MGADFASCFEVDSAMIAQALRPARSLDEALPRERVFDLIDRMAAVSAPARGATRVLWVLSHLAPCSWLDGRLVVRVQRVDSKTGVEALVDDGLTLNRLRPRWIFNAPFQEFEDSVRARAATLRPLIVAEMSADAVELTLSDTFDENLDAGVDPSFRRSHTPETPSPQDILRKPTVKMRTVTLPREAFRDDDEA